MGRDKTYFIYVLASHSGTLYIGMTNNLYRRVAEHKNKMVEGFTKKYGCTRLVYYEEYKDVNQAIRREKQLKNWNRKKKEFLIQKMNPEWVDLVNDQGGLR